MVWGIIGALDKEVELIKEKIALRETAELYHSPLYLGAYRGHDVAVACCGIGKVNAAVCASAMIREFHVDAIVNIGIAGSMSAGLGALDVAVSEAVAFHDQDPDLFERYYPYRRRFDADQGLLRTCIEALEGMGDRSFAYKTGLIASGDIFVNDSAAKAGIAGHLSPICVEMEGAAVGEVAFMNNTPFLVIRTLSDSADDDADTAYDNFMELAAENSARIVLRMMDIRAECRV